MCRVAKITLLLIIMSCGTPQVKTPIYTDNHTLEVTDSILSKVDNQIENFRNSLEKQSKNSEDTKLMLKTEQIKNYKLQQEILKLKETLYKLDSINLDMTLTLLKTNETLSKKNIQVVELKRRLSEIEFFRNQDKKKYEIIIHNCNEELQKTKSLNDKKRGN